MGKLLPDALGRLLVVEFRASRWTSSEEHRLIQLRPSGLLIAECAPSDPDSVAGLLRKISLAVGSPLLLAIEEEGGPVNPLRAFFPPLPSFRAAAEKGTRAVARMGALIGAALDLLGFNTNLAPVLDLAASQSEPRFTARTFGSDPTEVTRHGAVFVRGLRRHNILPCAKHFPGLGGVGFGEREPLPVVGRPMAELWHQDLLPYRELLPRLPMILMSHAVYKAYDFDLPCPAALSAQVIEGLLRVKLGYRRVVIGHKLENPAVRGALDLGEAAVKSINAGCDLLLVRDEKSVAPILTALTNAVESGKLRAAHVEQALGRIRAAQKGFAKPRGKISKPAFDRLAGQFEDFAKQFRPEERQIA